MSLVSEVISWKPSNSFSLHFDINKLINNITPMSNNTNLITNDADMKFKVIDLTQ